MNILERALEDLPDIWTNPEICSGKPVIKGTRITVNVALWALVHYGSIEGVQKSYPHLTEKQIKSALSYACRVLEGTIAEVQETRPVDFEELVKQEKTDAQITC